MKLLRTLSLAVLAFASMAHAQPSMQVKVMAVESIEDFQGWLQQKPAPQGQYRSLREVATGQRVHFPILVTGLRPPDKGEMRIVADVEFLGPDGKSLAAMKQCCSFTITNRPDIHTVMLGPTPSLAFEPNDNRGVYTIRVTVSDGTQTQAASEEVRFGATDEAPKAAPPGVPRLQMGTPPAKNPGRDADKRDCLSLPTPAEVIKCTEKK